MKEVTLAPGWLARDVKRAQARLDQWTATTARLNYDPGCCQKTRLLGASCPVGRKCVKEATCDGG